MAIDPAHGPGPGDAGRTGVTQTGATQQTAPDAVRNALRQSVDASDNGDTIQLSSASLALHAQTTAGASTPPSGTVSPEQLQAVVGRVMSGFYDQPPARQAIAAGVARDLGAGDGQS